MDGLIDYKINSVQIIHLLLLLQIFANYRRWNLNYQNVHWKEAHQYLTNKDKK